LETALKVLRDIASKRTHAIRSVLLVLGIISFVLAMLANSQILAFIGLGLVFWGALFFLITPLRYVEGSLLGSTAVSLYQSLDRMLRDLALSDHGYYIPPLPGNINPPNHLKGLTEKVVFVPESNDVEIPSIEEMSKGRFLLKNPKGILVVPPGAGLLAKIEKGFKTDFYNLGLPALCDFFPSFILEKLGLAEEMKMIFQGNVVEVKVIGSLYRDLYSSGTNLKSISVFGCPIISATACAIARATGQIVTVQNLVAFPNGQIEAQCVTIQG
jgi:hypothetical protein